jgi:hypothetical protein
MKQENNRGKGGDQKDGYREFTAIGTGGMVGGGIFAVFEGLSVDLTCDKRPGRFPPCRNRHLAHILSYSRPSPSSIRTREDNVPLDQAFFGPWPEGTG